MNMLLKAYEENKTEFRLVASISEDQIVFEQIFNKLRDEEIILNEKYSDDVFIVWDHYEKVKIDFRKIKHDLKNISKNNFIRMIKNYYLGKINNDSVSVRGEAKRINKIISISEQTKGFREMTQIRVDERMRKTLFELLEEAEIQVDMDYFTFVKSKSDPRDLSDSFITYYVVEDELKKFWQVASEKEKMIYFPFYLFWVICNIIPTRPYEFCITAYDCIVNEKGNYYLLLRKTPNKGNVEGKKKINNVKDYPILSVNIPSKIGKEIIWYKERTEKYNKKKEFLFTNETMNALLDKHFDEIFKVRHLTVLKEMFMARLINECGYTNVEDRKNGIISYSDNWVTNWALGDLRHLALINMIENQVDPALIMLYAGHVDISSACHYYSNASQYSKNRINYMESKKYNKVQRKEMKEYLNEVSYPVLEGQCFHKLGQEDNYCAKVDSCDNCKYFISEKGTEATKSAKIDELYKHFIDLIFKKEVEKAKETLVELQAELGRKYGTEN